MVQVLPAYERRPSQRKPTFAETFGLNQALSQMGKGFSESILESEKRKIERAKEEQENEFAQKTFGEDISGLKNKKAREVYFAEKFKGKEQGKRDWFDAFTKGQQDRQKFENEKSLLDQEYGLKTDFENTKNNLNSLADDKTYNTITDTWGKQAADIYQAATEGGKTRIIDELLEAGKRGLKFEDILPTLKKEIDNVKSAEDYDKGLTPKERTERQEKRYSTNLPLYQESKKRKESLEAEKDKLGILQELSPEIGGLSRLNINPTTGELIIPGAASTEAQRYIKTLNDFTTMAKDSYGSRVTNFDLTQYMKRLPSLANSSEAREQIIRQMQIINDINYAKEQALQDVIDEHGGIRNIDFDTAERLAEKRTNNSINKLKGEFKLIDNRLEKQYNQKIKEEKSIVPKGHIAVQKSDGTTGYIPSEKLNEFLKVPGNKKL